MINQNLFLTALGALTLINLSLFDFALGVEEPTVNQHPFASIDRLEEDEMKVKGDIRANLLVEEDLNLFLQLSLENHYFKIKEDLKISQDDVEKAKQYRLEAQQGVAKAQHNLGVCYLIGRGVPQDYKEAATLFQLAAEQGIIESQYNMAVLYRKGMGVPQNEEEALRLIQLTAEKGVDRAQYNLGLRYLKGEGVPQNEKKAVKLFQVAALKRHALAQLRLGILHHLGQGVLQDDKKAASFWQLAADQGVTKAQFYLQMLNKKKRRLQQDEEEEEAARLLLQLAADQWHPRAQSHADIIHLEGSESRRMTKNPRISTNEQ